jgi:hypothetical protein
MARAQATYEEAFQARQRGNLEEAEHLLELASAAIESLSPSIAMLLTEMRRASPTDATMPPLRPGQFRQPALASIACLHRVVNLFMVTPAQRHRLRVYMLRQSWAIATGQLRALSRLRARRKAQAIWSESPWIEETREVKAAFERLFGRRPDDALWQLAERREQWRQAPQLPAMTLWAALIIAALVVSIALR